MNYFKNLDKCFIIAEAGVNHNGDMELGKKLIEAAKESGADAVKFQTFKTEKIITKIAPKSTYHLQATKKEESWFELLKSQELKKEHHHILIDHCKKVEIEFLSTPYDEESVDLLKELNIPLFKVASTDLTNIPLLKYIAKNQKPIIISTGMATIEEIDDALTAIRTEGNNDIAILHCTANYPAKIENANIRVISSFIQRYPNLIVGYSDHIPHNCVAHAAISLGARIYEKHFTLDKNLPGPDHLSSLEPHELKVLIDEIRMIETVLGSSNKQVTSDEEENRYKLRKSIVTNDRIKTGDIFTFNNLSIKRPGTGILPKEIYNIVGKRASKDIENDTVLAIEDIAI